MFTVIMIAAPARADLTDEAAGELRARLEGGPVAWLSRGIAAEFAVGQVPLDFKDIWRDWQARGLDLAIVPTAGRRKAVLLADMDSTMIEQECLDELADVAGYGPQVAAITARAMNGELEFEPALIERVAVLEGLPESVIAEVLDCRISPTPGGRTLVATMRAQGAWTVLVSGGFTGFTAPVAERLGFDAQRANVLLAESGKLTGRVALPILGREAKVQALEEITAARGLTPADAIAVGDGANDLGMLKLAGMGVALHAKPVVAAQAPVRINFGDLTSLLYLQGYAEGEFVRN